MTNLEIVWNNSIGVGERCIKNDSGDFVGVETYQIYSKDNHYASEKLRAIIRRVDDKQQNGMLHLDPQEDIYKRKYNFVGCEMTFREAHLYRGLKVYQSYETGEYYNQNELEVLV